MPPGWLSVVTSVASTWEERQNEQSHRDPTLAEALLEARCPTQCCYSRWITSSAVSRRCKPPPRMAGFWTLVVSKRAVIASQL